MAGGCTLAAPAWAQPAANPVATGPALPYSAAVAERFADPAIRYVTPGLAPGRDSYTSNEELAQWLQALAQPHSAEADAPSATPSAPLPPGRAARPAPPRLLQVGRSTLGQALWAVHFSSAEPAAAPRPVLLALAQQHGNEPAGAEALLVLARQLAQGELNSVLQRLDVVLLPRANPDGAAAAARLTAAGHDMNRDHLLLHTPEARAVAALVQRLQPLVVVDLHEYLAVGRWRQSFGGEARHDLLLQTTTTANLDPAWQQMGQDAFLGPVARALAAQGLRSEQYHENFSSTPPADGSGALQRRLLMGGVQPGLARNAYGLQHGVGLLLESRGIGIGRLHIQRRVHSHAVALHAVLAAAAEQAPALLALREQTRADASAQACQGTATVLAAHRAGSRELLFLDPATGADKVVQVPWEDALQRLDVTRRARPCGYWLAADADESVQRLRLLGLQLVRLTQPQLLQTEAWVERERAADAEGLAEGAAAAAASRLRRVEVTLLPRTLLAPAGSWWLPLSQPLAALALAALEPDSPSSYFANRLLPQLDSAARVTAPPVKSSLPVLP